MIIIRRDLAAKIARNVVDHIESTQSIIVQNIEEVIYDALLLDAAKRIAPKQETNRPYEGTFTAPRKIQPREYDWGSLKNWWQDETE